MAVLPESVFSIPSNVRRSNCFPAIRNGTTKDLFVLAPEFDSDMIAGLVRAPSQRYGDSMKARGRTVEVVPRQDHRRRQESNRGRAPSSSLQSIHNCMPVIIDKANINRWLAEIKLNC
jgi:hypothetical protein